MHLSAIFVQAVAAIFTSKFIHATPTSQPDISARYSYTSHDWTYGNLYDYAVSKGGPNDPTAQVLLTNLNHTGIGWNEKYGHDIVLNNGVLTVAQSPGGRAELEKRAMPGWTYVVAYPWVGDCQDSVSWTWSPAPENEWVGYWRNGVALRMYSAYVNIAGRVFNTYGDLDCMGYNQRFSIPDPQGNCVATSDGTAGWHFLPIFSRKSTTVCGT
jgi:hypothetical protein